MTGSPAYGTYMTTNTIKATTALQIGQELPHQINKCGLLPHEIVSVEGFNGALKITTNEGVFVARLGQELNFPARPDFSTAAYALAGTPDPLGLFTYWDEVTEFPAPDDLYVGDTLATPWDLLSRKPDEFGQPDVMAEGPIVWTITAIRQAPYVPQFVQVTATASPGPTYGTPVRSWWTPRNLPLRTPNDPEAYDVNTALFRAEPAKETSTLLTAFGPYRRREDGALVWIANHPTAQRGGRWPDWFKGTGYRPEGFNDLLFVKPPLQKRWAKDAEQLVYKGRPGRHHPKDLIGSYQPVTVEPDEVDEVNRQIERYEEYRAQK